MADQNPPASVLQRVLAFAALGLVVLALAAFATELIGLAAGAAAHDGFSRGIWPVVLTLPGIALPLGFVLIIILLVASAVRRSRMNRLQSPDEPPVAHAGREAADDPPAEKRDRRR